MIHFNQAYSQVFKSGQLTVGLMTPAGQSGRMANVKESFEHAALADKLGFAALWARDVPLMVPQGSDNKAVALDDPFLWLAGLAMSTKNIALGAAAIVVPLRHPLHVAKAALSLDRLSGGRFILGLGSGDRPAEYDAFGKDLEARRAVFHDSWPLLRSALSPVADERRLLLEATAGYDLMEAPQARIPMMVVGSARQSVQWIAQNSDAWITYHRVESRQQGRINLWRQALSERAGGAHKPFVQSLELQLLESPAASSEPLELGLRTGRNQLIEYLGRLKGLGVGHVIVHLSNKGRPISDMIREIGQEVLPRI